MIRSTTPVDTPALLAVAAGTDVFTAADVETLREVLDDYHAAYQDAGHHCVIEERDGAVIGFAYYAPTPMTDRTWTLWWIAVSRQTQSRGVGAALLRYVEDAIRQENGRLLVAETSSLPSYAATRRFYIRNGYHVLAELKDYYADGHDMVIFAKRL